jgi:hypothetical protein
MEKHQIEIAKTRADGIRRLSIRAAVIPDKAKIERGDWLYPVTKNGQISSLLTKSAVKGESGAGIDTDGHVFVVCKSSNLVSIYEDKIIESLDIYPFRKIYTDSALVDLASELGFSSEASMMLFFRKDDRPPLFRRIVRW